MRESWPLEQAVSAMHREAIGSVVVLDSHAKEILGIVSQTEIVAAIAQRGAHALAHEGDQYDLANVVDLARYLLPTPPVPTRWRRRMIALGSGEPTKAICSTLIAQAFQSIRYPILPIVSREMIEDPNGRERWSEILHIRHYSLFTPRDFDVSPYFAIVKPTIAAGFDHRKLTWADGPPSRAKQIEGTSSDPAIKHR